MRLFCIEIEILRRKKHAYFEKKHAISAYFLENICLSSENVVNLHDITK